MAAAISPHDATDKELLTFLAPHYADALMSRQPVRHMLITNTPACVAGFTDLLGNRAQDGRSRVSSMRLSGC